MLVQDGRPSRLEQTADEVEMLTTARCAVILGVAPSTLRQWRFRRHGPPYVRVGPKIVRYPRPELQAWLAAQHRGGDRVATP